jgi:hypothetical protein
MRNAIRTSLKLLPILTAVAILAAPSSASAQSQLDTSEAQTFLGNWTLAFESEMGPFQVGLNIRDAEGKVAAQVVSEMGNVEITTITRSEDSLVLSYTMEAQGQSLPVSMSLKPDGEQLQASMNFAEGAFMVNGTATKAAN